MVSFEELANARKKYLKSIIYDTKKCSGGHEVFVRVTYDQVLSYINMVDENTIKLRIRLFYRAVLTEAEKGVERVKSLLNSSNGIDKNTPVNGEKLLIVDQLIKKWSTLQQEQTSNKTQKLANIAAVINLLLAKGYKVSSQNGQPIVTIPRELSLRLLDDHKIELQASSRTERGEEKTSSLPMTSAASSSSTTTSISSSATKDEKSVISSIRDAWFNELCLDEKTASEVLKKYSAVQITNTDEATTWSDQFCVQSIDDGAKEWNRELVDAIKAGQQSIDALNTATVQSVGGNNI